MTSTAEEVLEIVLALAKAFWPGPLTMGSSWQTRIYCPALYPLTANGVISYAKSSINIEQSQKWEFRL